MTADLADQLRAAIDQHERDVEGSNHICDCGMPGCVDGKIRDVLLRSITAHRRIVERHTPRPADEPGWECSWCNSDAVDQHNERPYKRDWPCPDLRDLAGIYLERVADEADPKLSQADSPHG